MSASLLAVSPIDGRYADKTKSLQEYFSEFGLIKRRVQVEVQWLLRLGEKQMVPGLPPFGAEARAVLEGIQNNFGVEEAQRVKEIDVFRRKVRLSLLEHDARRAYDARGVARASLDDVARGCEADDVLWGEVPRRARESRHLDGGAEPVVSAGCVATQF